MEIARICGGFTLAQADMLRRAIGKKIPEELAKARASFIRGCRTTVGMSEREATDLFGLIERFADYGFNKSHAVAYAHIGYVTGLYKALHPDIWIAASIDREEDAVRRDILADEARAMGVEILPPCVNRSAIACGIDMAAPSRAFRLGLGFIKGVGRASTGVAARIVHARAAGPFRDLDDFIDRMEANVSSARARALAEAGAFDIFGESREGAARYIEVRLAAKTRTSAVTSQTDLFGTTPAAVPSHDARQLLMTPERHDRLALERVRLGFVVSDPDSDTLLARACEGKVAWRIGGEDRVFIPRAVEDVLKDAKNALAGGEDAGRVIAAALVAEVKPLKDGAPYRVVLKTGLDRMEAVITSADPHAIGKTLQDAAAARSPVLCCLEWSLDREGRPEFRVVDAPPFATVVFDGRKGDIRVRVSHQQPGGLDAVLRRVMEALGESGAALATPGSRGIILMTDGVQRRVVANRWRADEPAALEILAVSGVCQVYVGRQEVHARVAGAPSKMAAGARPGLS